jgi:hypothetical protein
MTKISSNLIQAQNMEIKNKNIMYAKKKMQMKFYFDNILNHEHEMK